MQSQLSNIMRCPDCSKFVSMENGEPEINTCEASQTDSTSIEIEIDGRHTRNCADCGTELKEVDFNASKNFDFADTDAYKLLSDAQRSVLKWAFDNNGDIQIEAENSDAQVDEGGGGRYKKNLIKIVVPVDVTLTYTYENDESDPTAPKLPDNELEIKLTATVDVETENAAGDYCECC